MDALDVRILRAMGFRPFERRPRDPGAIRPANVARTLGEPVNTVKDRIARMERTGVIRGYRIVPNLRHLGLAASAFYFHVDSEDAKDASLADVRALGRVLEVHDFLGRGVCADFAFASEGDLGAKLAELSKITGDPAPLRFYDREMPPVGRDLAPIDWRIIHALRGNAMRPLASVASDLGVATRTVVRRFDRMADQGSFFVVPLLDPGKAEGLFIFDLLVFFEPDAPAELPAALVNAFNGSAVYAYVPAHARFGNFDLLVFARTTSEVEELRRRATSLKGVARAEAWFFRGFYDHSSWIDDATAERALLPVP